MRGGTVTAGMKEHEGTRLLSTTDNDISEDQKEIQERGAERWRRVRQTETESNKESQSPSSGYPT